MKKEYVESYKEQQEFISKLNEIIQGHIPNVEQVRLEVLVNTNKDEVEKVLLVIRFKGGAISVRNCSGNSNVANLQEFSKYCLGGYYDEVNDYFLFKQTLVNLEDYINGEY